MNVQGIPPRAVVDGEFKVALGTVIPTAEEWLAKATEVLGEKMVGAITGAIRGRVIQTELTNTQTGTVFAPGGMTVSLLDNFNTTLPLAYGHNDPRAMADFRARAEGRLQPGQVDQSDLIPKAYAAFAATANTVVQALLDKGYGVLLERPALSPADYDERRDIVVLRFTSSPKGADGVEPAYLYAGDRPKKNDPRICVTGQEIKAARDVLRGF